MSDYERLMGHWSEQKGRGRLRMISKPLMELGKHGQKVVIVP